MSLKKLITVLIMSLALTVTSSALEWQEINHGANAVMINDIITVGDYEFVAIDEAPMIYRRKIGERTWHLVHEDFDDVGTYDREYRLVYYKERLIALREEKDLTRRSSVVSVDSGVTWEKFDEFGHQAQWDIADAAIVRDTLVLVYSNSVYATIDLEEGKKRVYSHEEDSVTAVALHGGSFYVGTSGRICKVSDLGETKEDLQNGLPEHSAVRDILVVDSLTMYASTDDGVYRTTDGGQNWGLLDPQFNVAKHSVMTQLIRCDSSIYGMSKHKVYRLAPSSERFFEIVFPTNDQYDRIKLSSCNNKLSIAGVGGVYEYDAGTGQLSLIDDGFGKHPRVAELYTGEKYIYARTYRTGGNYAILKASAEGLDCKTILTVKGDSVVFNQNDNYLCLTLDSAGRKLYYYSRDYGEHWEKREKYNNPLYNGRPINHENDTLYHKRDRSEDFLIEYSVDEGKTWDTLSSYTPHYLQSFTVKSGSKMYFTYTSHPPGPTKASYTTLYYSEDYGKTITKCDVIGARNMTLVEAPNGNLLACGSRGIYLSTDKGESWIQKDTVDQPVWAALSMYDSTVIGYDYFREKLNYYYSHNFGASWALLPGTQGEDSLNHTIRGAEVKRNASTIFCVEMGRIYKIDAEELTKGVSVISETPQIDAVQNLFTSNLNKTDISLQLNLAQKDSYSVTLFNASGRLMQSQSGVARSNRHAISLDHTGLSHGYYLLQVIAGDRKEIRPIILQ